MEKQKLIHLGLKVSKTVSFSNCAQMKSIKIICYAAQTDGHSLTPAQEIKRGT